MSNNFYAILAWCWWLGLRVSLILSDLKLLQGLDSLFFSILRNCHSILYKVKMFIIVWVSWSHSCCFHSFRSTTKYWWYNLKNHSYLQIKAWGKCFICNKDICANDASSLTNDGWKTLTQLAKTWSSVVLPIDHQYYEDTQFRELIGDRKTAFCKQHRSGHCRPAFGSHSLFNKLKNDNGADKPGTEAAAASTLLPLNTSLLNPRSNKTRTHSSTGNTKKFEQICFPSHEKCPCDSHAYNEDELGVCEFKSEREWLTGAANTSGERNSVNIIAENVRTRIW